MVEHDTRIRGSCLCRAVAYTVAGHLGPMWHCHCLICRKLSGAAFATYVEAQTSGFSWLRGQEHLTHYALSATLVRSFCQRCGSVAPYATSDGTRMVLPAGVWMTTRESGRVHIAVWRRKPRGTPSPTPSPALPPLRPPSWPAHHRLCGPRLAHGKRWVAMGVVSVAGWSMPCAARWTSSRTAIVGVIAR